MLNTAFLQNKTLPIRVDFRAMLRIPGRVIQAAIDLYALGIVLYFLLRLAGMGQLAPVLFMSNFIHLALLPAFVLLPLMLVRRRWWVVGFLVVHVGAFSMLFGSLFVPKSHAAPAGATVITAMTFNVASYNEHPDKIIPALRQSGADIIALQEVSTFYFAAIERELSDLYPYRFRGENRDMIAGKALLSRYPILEQTTFGVVPERLILEVLLDVDGQFVQVFDVHPPPPAVRNEAPYFMEHPYTTPEFDALLDHMRTDLPVMVLCDCNMTDQNANYRRLRDAGLTDAFRAVGQGFGLTFPADDGGIAPYFPAYVRIDYIWTNSYLAAITASVYEVGGSDHFPVMAEVMLK